MKMFLVEVIKNSDYSPGWLAQFVGALSLTLKVAGLIPGQNTYLGAILG